MSAKNLLKLVVGVLLTTLLLVMTAGPSQARTYTDFVSFTNSVLNDLESEKGSSPGFRAARSLFNEPRYAQVDWNGGDLLCRFFRGDSSAGGAVSAARVVWRVEKALLDTFRGAGGEVVDWQDFMLVRFTLLSSSINAQCPSYNNLVMGPFSDALFALFDSYRSEQSGNSTATSPMAPVPAPGSTPSQTGSSPNSQGTVTVLTKPVFLGTVDDGSYTRILFPTPTVWDTWGVKYTVLFASNKKIFCEWTAVFDKVDFDSQGQGEGNCAGTRTKGLRGKSRWMYIEKSSDLGKVIGDPFKVKFSKSK